MIYLIRTANSMATKLIYELIEESIINTGYKYEVYEELNKNFKPKKEDLIIVGDALTGYKLLKRFKNVVIWFQGVIPEESYMKHRSKIRQSILREIEKKAYNNSIFKILVTPKMYEHYEKKYNKNRKGEHIIIPCFSEKEIQKTSFNVEGKYSKNKFVYVGSTQEWQLFNYTIQLYKKIETASTNSTELLVLTPSIEEAKSIAKKHDVKNITIKYVKQSQINEELKDVKYGFILRDESIVNQVATPTKFSSYISNGIIPIFSSSLTDFTRISLFTTNKVELLELNLEKNTKQILTHMNKDIDMNSIYKDYSKIYMEYYNYSKYVDMLTKSFLKIMVDSNA